MKKLQHERIEAMDAEMQKLEKNSQEMEEMLKKLQEIQSRLDLLHEYYKENWMEDFKTGARFGILSEDGLYHLFYEIDEKQRSILKYLAKNL